MASTSALRSHAASQTDPTVAALKRKKITAPEATMLSGLRHPPPPPPPVNNAPVANFTWSCPTLTCNLDASTSTDDGSIVSYSWNFGMYPNGTGSGMIVNPTYPHVGDRVVTLTVTDNGGLTGTITKTLTVQ